MNIPMENKLPRLLLHVCCGPCSTTVLERLVPHYAVSVFFFNPNIAPNAEYDKRKNEAERYIQQTYGSKIPSVAGNADPALFLEAVRGYENEPEGGRRCEICFRLRLQETARYAKENNFDFFCTTLTLSPHKNAKLINTLGEETACRTGGISYLPSDFKKKDGFRRSVELSQKEHLYRQTYCGCVFSI